MNFTYLEKYPRMKKLYDYCKDAEQLALDFPTASAISARKAMEFIVKMIFSSLISYDMGQTVFEMITDQRFIDYINDATLINSIHFIRKMGNVAAHDGSLTQDEALKVLEELHFITGEFIILLALEKDYPVFVAPNKANVPARTQPAVIVPEEPKKPVVVPPELVAEFAPRMRYTRFNVKFNRDEEENKKLFLYASLREAGWPVVNQKDQTLPCSACVEILLDNDDSVDYILTGRDNKPLAIIEYTTTVKNIVEGRKKGIEKADKLAVKYGYKPVVYYTNGYHIYVIDQLGYKPRRVFQFHSMEELELFKLRANIRLDLSNPQINDNITNRDYQKKAITSVCNAFSQKRRHALLVMATGTGKTRVSISCVDVLMKNNWVKNVLFLADRTSLVRQAHKNFNKLLPNVTTSIYTGGSTDRDPNARIIFSTYQTMINLINDDTREFGIGRFDLIIIDEAHRSIFRKYGALFHYFDALMIGLTATPRAEDNKNTYKTFELPNGQPDFAYELEEAINDGYLVGFSVLDKTTDKMRRGISYDELTDEQKQAFEDAFATGDVTEDMEGMVIQRKHIGKHVINLGTIDAMLADLMKNGLKIDGGDKLGKTIIFADSHVSAEKIVERFNKIYSYLGKDFCKLIDSKSANPLGMIDRFGERDKLPQIAVSVDMMDTGIDVPDVLNLVFFKSVYSKIKFLQMVGRGTRLSADVFGPDIHKEGFLIFDYFDNFNYFSSGDTWSTVKDQIKAVRGFPRPQGVLINSRKLNILRALTEKDNLSPFEEEYRKKLKNHFIAELQSLCNDDIDVQYNMPYVNKYRTAEQWDGFTDEKVQEINSIILPLIPGQTANPKVKSFDLIMLLMEDKIPEFIAENKDIRKIRNGFFSVATSLTDRMNELLKLQGKITEIKAKEELITAMIGGNYIFDNFSLERCEEVRKELRDLMVYLPNENPYVIFNIPDTVITGGVDVAVGKTYQQKAMEYLNNNTPALAKLINLDPLSQDEKKELQDVFMSKLGTPSEYALWSGNAPLLPFLRTQIGISDHAINTKFSSFLNSEVLNEDQLEYMHQIIDYTKENGDISTLDLQRISPFCDVDIIALFGSNLSYVKVLIDGLHKPVM